MKLAIAVGILALSRPAAACPPLPTCAVDYCHAAEAVAEATVIDVSGTLDAPIITLDVTTAFGDVTVGEITLGAAPGVIDERDLGRVVVVVLQRDQTALAIDERIAFGPAFDTACFAADASLADVATTLLGASCAVELDIRRDGPPCDDGGCTTTRNPSALVVLAALIAARRRRARHVAAVR